MELIINIKCIQILQKKIFENMAQDFYEITELASVQFNTSLDQSWLYIYILIPT